MIKELGHRVAVAIDPDGALVEVAKHDPLRVIARAGRVAGIDRFREPNGDRGSMRRNGTRGQQALLLERAGLLRASRRADSRVGAGSQQGHGTNEGNAMRWHEITIHYTISPWDSHALSS